MLKTILRPSFTKGFEICRFASAGVKSRTSMKTLYLLRHAKSSWDDPSQTDFERPLNQRGIKAAPFMGNLMAQKGFTPSVIICSPAMRAKTTARLVKDAGGFSEEIVFEKSIYEASPNNLRNSFQTQRGSRFSLARRTQSRHRGLYPLSDRPPRTNANRRTRRDRIGE